MWFVGSIMINEIEPRHTIYSNAVIFWIPWLQASARANADPDNYIIIILQSPPSILSPFRTLKSIVVFIIIITIVVVGVILLVCRLRLTIKLIPFYLTNIYYTEITGRYTRKEFSLALKMMNPLLPITLPSARCSTENCAYKVNGKLDCGL